MKKISEKVLSGDQKRTIFAIGRHFLMEKKDTLPSWDERPYDVWFLPEIIRRRGILTK